MRTYQINPGSGAGPITLGMSRDEAVFALRAIGADVEQFGRWPGKPDVLMAEQNDLQVFFDANDHVFEVQLSGPSNGARREGGQPLFRAMLNGVDVLSAKAVEVIATLPAFPDSHSPNPRLDYTYCSLGLLLWRDGDLLGAVEVRFPFFDGVLVRAPSLSC
jgi:hypothetical protein